MLNGKFERLLGFAALNANLPKLTTVNPPDESYASQIMLSGIQIRRAG